MFKAIKDWVHKHRMQFARYIIGTQALELWFATGDRGHLAISFFFMLMFVAELVYPTDNDTPGHPKAL